MPNDVAPVASASADLTFMVGYQSDRRRSTLPAPIEMRRLKGLNPSHWWLVART
jgi:hypothetical protein